MVSEVYGEIRTAARTSQQGAGAAGSGAGGLCFNIPVSLNSALPAVVRQGSALA